MKKGRSSKKKIVAITSIALGFIITTIMSIYRKTLGEFSLIKKIVQYKRLASEGMKDFFEVQELELRFEKLKYSNHIGVKPIYDGIKIIWNSDGSTDYILILSSEYISKSAAINPDIIQELKLDEVDKLNNQGEWIRKVTLIGIDNNHLYYHVPFDKFQCKIKSSKGRVSKLLKYPARRQTRKEKKEIDAWISEIGKQYYISIKSPKNSSGGKILEYQVILYMNDGKGVIRTIQPFEGSTMLCLGELSPCLCYIKAIMNIGVPIEQFICWIKEDEAMKIDLDEFDLDSGSDHENTNNIDSTNT